VEITLDRVGMLTEDVNATIEFYSQMLGMRVVGRSSPESKNEGVLLVERRGTPVLAVEVVGPPFLPWAEGIYARSGPVRDHLGFLSRDLNLLHTNVTEVGVEIEWESRQEDQINEFTFRDARGIVVRCIRATDVPDPPKPPVVKHSSGELAFHLHHVSIVSDELASHESFYHRVLGLKTVFDLKREGIVFLADPTSIARQGREAPCVEIIAPPGLWERERDFLEQHGPGIDHISFFVPDVDAAYEELRAKGALFHVDPVDFEGTRLAFFKDPNGLDIEIEQPYLPQVFDL
jgi:catechol 2,3-dioxygenase-like lactoylglutathione lyase family enzyme